MSASLRRFNQTRVGFVSKRLNNSESQRPVLSYDEKQSSYGKQWQQSEPSTSIIGSGKIKVMSTSDNTFSPPHETIPIATKSPDTKVKNRIPALISTESLSVSLENDNQQGEMKKNHRFQFRHLSCRKRLIILAIIAGILLICCAVILTPILILRQKTDSSLSSFTNTTVSMCSRSTCMGLETPLQTSMTTLLYAFDGNLYDSTGLSGGTSLGAPPSTTYSTAAMATQSLFLSSFSFQYVSIPYVNLSQQSFTLQIWVAVSYDNTSVDYGIFSQCSSIDNICFSLSIRNNHVALSFDSTNVNGNTLIGSTAISYGIWNHITIVYDIIAQQQLIYLNGRIDAVSKGIVSPYRGTPTGITTTTIGYSSSYAYPSSYFYGYIDQMTISSGTVRSVCQILNDATLLVYFPFNTYKQLADYSVNNYIGYALNIQTITLARVQQAILFNLSTSYFQCQCFPSTRTYMPYTISLWIYPKSFSGGGTLIHISSLQNGTGTYCYDLLALTTTGHVVIQLMLSATNITDYQGSTLSTNTWTHLALVYSSTSGMRLFVNGELSVHTRMSVYIPPSSPILFVTLANTNPKGSAYTINCPSGSSTGFVSGPFSGGIDDFRIYNRELDAQEICVLANM